MYRTRKTRVTLLAVLLLLVMAVTGCGQTTTATTPEASSTAALAASAEASSSTPSAEPTPEPTPALEPVELTWLMFGGSLGKDQAMVEAAMSDYLKDKINVSIKILMMDWDEFITRTNAMSAANEPFDIVFSPIWIGFNDGLFKNMYLDITEMFPTYCPGTKELLGEDFLKSGMSEGKLFAIPTNKEKAHSYGFLFNKQLVDKHNLDINSVTDYKSLEPLLEVIKREEPEVEPFQLSHGGSPDAFLDVFPVTGDDVLPLVVKRNDKQVYLKTALPELLDLYRTTESYVNKGYISKDAATKKLEENAATREAGRVFCWITNLRPGTEVESSNDTVTWVPKRITPVYMGNKDLGGSMNSISRTSRHPERALMFLELLNTDPVLNNLLAHGIEGTHYTKVSDSIIEPVADSGFSHGWQWAFANQFLNYLKTSENPDRWTQMEAFNAEAIPEPSLGFSFKLEDYDTEVAAIKLALSESYAGFGLTDPEKALNELNQKLNDAGVERLMTDIQAAYEDWLAQ